MLLSHEKEHKCSFHNHISPITSKGENTLHSAMGCVVAIDHPLPNLIHIHIWLCLKSMKESMSSPSARMSYLCLFSM